jgi:hypothetical protein
MDTQTEEARTLKSALRLAIGALTNESNKTATHPVLIKSFKEQIDKMATMLEKMDTYSVIHLLEP